MASTLLIIDDEIKIRSLLARILELEGFTVLQAQNAKEGLKIITNQDVLVVVSDVKLPDASGVELLKQIKDFGKGIEEQYQKRLFDRYYQVPTDGQNKSGSGLGLAISKDFIEAQNGKIWLESAVGEGSKFSFSLPAV